jgi:putative membrane protein
MSRVFGYIFLLVILLAVLFFSLLNVEAVDLNLHFVILHRPLALYLVITLFLGVILGMLASLPGQIHTRREASRLRRKMRATEAEIKNLRNMPIRDEH